MRRLLTVVAMWGFLSLITAGTFLLWELPRHPHSMIGWTLLLVGALPVTILGEYLSERLIYKSPLGLRVDSLGPGARGSTIRIIYLLVWFIGGIVLFTACLAGVARLLNGWG